MPDPKTPVEIFEERQVQNLLDAVRFLNVSMLLTRVTDSAVRRYLYMSLLAMSELYNDPIKEEPSEPADPAGR